MHAPDYIILCAYLFMTLVVGAFFARRQTRYEDFFLAGRSMAWLPIGLSLMVTAFSAVNYTAFSGEVFSHGLYVTLCLPVFALVAIPVTRLIMPFYHQMGLTSAYAYLEHRFDVRVRCLAGGLFIVWRVAWMATMLFVPCKVLSVITGLDQTLLILLAGSVATAYTTSGGMKAVMWTDVLQFFILAAGILAGVIIAVDRTPGGLSGILRLAAADGLLKPFHPFDPGMFSFNPHVRITLWSCWIGSFTAFVARYGVDQVVVQRYFTARSLQDARRGFHLNYISATVALLALALLGLAIHAFASVSGLLGAEQRPPIHYFAMFVQSLPTGATGLVAAGLFAATMSSIDSGINSCSAVCITDFYHRFRRGDSQFPLALSRWVSLACGALSTLCALQVDKLGSVFEIANKIINGLGSPLLALFVLGMFSRRANAVGVLGGGMLGLLGSVYVSLYVENLALHYYAVVNLVGTLVLGYTFSLLENRLRGVPTAFQLAWTWQARRRLYTPRSERD